MADQWQQPQQVDFITKLARTGFYHLAETVLAFLDADSLHNASRVSPEWSNIIREGRLWMKLVARMVASDRVWAIVAQRRGLRQVPTNLAAVDRSAEHIYLKIATDIRELDERWQSGRFTARRLNLYENLTTDLVKCDDNTMIVGSYTRGVQIFDGEGRVCRKTFRRDLGRVNCLQYDERMIICASHDGYIRAWDRNDPHGSEACFTLLDYPLHVVDLKFGNGMLIVCPVSEPHLMVWSISSPREFRFAKRLDLSADLSFHVDFDERFIVAGSSSGIIRVWDAKTLEQLRAMRATELLHSCEYRNGLAVGTCYNKIMIWDVESGIRIRTLDSGSPNLIRFDEKRFMALTRGVPIIRTQQIRVWDLGAVLNRDVPNEALTYVTLALPNNFLAQDMQFDALKIKCWTARVMLILDFLGEIQSREE